MTWLHLDIRSNYFIFSTIIHSSLTRKQLHACLHYEDVTSLHGKSSSWSLGQIGRCGRIRRAFEDTHDPVLFSISHRFVVTRRMRGSRSFSGLSKACLMAWWWVGANNWVKTKRLWFFIGLTVWRGLTNPLFRVCLVLQPIYQHLCTGAFMPIWSNVWSRHKVFLTILWLASMWWGVCGG